MLDGRSSGAACTTSPASTPRARPDYGRVDIRVDRTFTVGGQPLNIFLGVQNLTNRQNFASYSWNRRTNAQQFGEQQGIFPILGFDWRF